MKQPIFIDTDMGVDDIVAIGLLLLSEKYDIKGVSVVNGVASTKRGVANARRLLRAFNCNAPVFMGITQKEQSSTVQFPALDRNRANNLTLISRRFPSQKPQVSSLNQAEKLLSQEKKPVTLFCLGPLSNVKLFLQDAKVAKKIRRLVMMGGAVFKKGNVPPAYIAEYNIRLDVPSAKNIFDQPIQRLLIPIDATSYAPAIQTRTTKKTLSAYLFKFLQWLKNYTPNTNIGTVLKDIVLNNSNDFVNFYDPLAVLVYINPMIIVESKIGAIVVSEKKSSLGKTIFTSQGNRSNEIVVQVDTRLFFDQFKKLLQRG
jgi:inosine-uridine nucleoside N-ribohydrolase